jgi:plastocyanin
MWKLNKICNFISYSVISAFFIFITPLTTLAEESGYIKGIVKTPWVKLSRALVYLDRVEGREFPPPEKNPFVSQKSFAFTPHVLPVLKGATVDFTNDDGVVHNVFAPPGSAKRFNLGNYGAGVKKTVTFDKTGEVELRCNIHPEMLGYVIVLQNPYFALTDKKGNFEIGDIPPGKYRMIVWHERFKEASQEVTIEAGKSVSVKFSKKELKKR